jgi:lipoate-protein ligase A
MLSDEWLFRRGRPQIGREVTIRAGVQVWQKAYKAPGGLIRAVLEVREGTIADISLSGDFFFYPAERLADLERALLGVRVEDVEQVVARFYADYGIESPGVTAADFARTVQAA